MKRVNNIFDKLISFGNLYFAFKKAMKGSSKKYSSSYFHFNYEKEIIKLRDELKNGTYKPERYRYFMIYEPKEREISVAGFRDRVVHHALINVLEPVFDKRFIFHSYATRKNKGTQKAIKQAQNYLKNKYFYLKSDIKKYFQNIDHSILIYLIERKIKDKKIMDLIGIILQNNDISKERNLNKGLPIGNLTSQFFANIYLDKLDHFVKEDLKIRYYIRYMDDFVFFENDKEKLKEILFIINNYLRKNLKLGLKEKATFINTRLNGLPFLGMRIFPNNIRIKKENVNRIVKKINLRRYQFLNSKISEKKYIQSLNSIYSFLRFADTYNLRLKMIKNGGGI